MNLQFLEALQEFVSEVNSELNETTEWGMKNPDLDEKAGALDSMCHALIKSEKARLNVLAENS